MLVELACSTTLTPAYNRSFFDHLVPSRSDTQETKMVVFIICGGFKISLKEMEEYREIVSADLRKGKNDWEVLYNGEVLLIPK